MDRTSKIAAVQRKNSVCSDRAISSHDSATADGASAALRAIETAGAPFAVLFRFTVADPNARDPAFIRIFVMSIVWLGAITCDIP